MNDYESQFDRLVADERYQRNLDWGAPRPGHPEGTLRAHIAELEKNADTLRPRLSEVDVWRLRLLVHSHDTFKPDAEPGVAITHPRSHASLARAFLAEFTDDADLLAMVQYHDEPYALWRQRRFKGNHNVERFESLLANVADWNLFFAFQIVDGCTEGKSRDPLVWLFGEVDGKVESDFTEADIL